MAILKNIKQHWLITAILVLGVAYRFIPINQYQFSHDELSGLSRTIFPTLSQEIEYGVKVLDTHPLLIQVFLWFWVKIFGYSEIAIKTPFLICGILSVFFIYKFCKEFFTETTGFVAATVLSFSFIFLVYSSYARMYISGVLFSIIFLLFIFRILFSETVKTKDYLGFIVVGLLCAYNHHMSCLFAFTASSLSLFYIKKERLYKYLFVCMITLILYLPHLSITLYQFSSGGLGFSSGGWLSPPRTNELYFFIKALLGCGLSGKINMFLFSLLMFVSIFKLTPITKKQLFLLWIFCLNYTIIHLYSIFRSPVLQFSVLLFSGICLILFLSSFISFLPKKQVTLFCFVLIALFSFQSFRKKHIFSKVHQHDYEMQVKTTIAMQKRVGEKNVTSIFGGETFFIYAYEKKYHTKLNYLLHTDSVCENDDKLRAYLKQLKNPYIVVAGVGPAKIQLIKEYFPYIVSHQEDYFDNVLVLSKWDFGNYDVSILNSIPLLNSDINLYLEKNKSILFSDEHFVYQADSTDKEFTFNLSIPIEKLNVKEGEFLVSELSFESDTSSQITSDKLCISVSEKGKDALFFKSIELKDFIDTKRKTQKAYLELFIGTEFKNWLKRKTNITVYIWKQKQSKFRITNFKLKQIDYNPTKWTLFE